MDSNFEKPPVAMAADSEADDSTVYTAATPPESDIADSEDDYWPEGTVAPRAGANFVIRCVQTGDVITLHDDKITLAHEDERGCNEWVCVEDGNGRLGFKNDVSGRFLGYGDDWSLCCAVTRHKLWERFRALPRQRGGYVLVMSHWWYGAQPVGIRREGGVKKLAMIKNWEAEEALWIFEEKPPKPVHE